MPFSLPTLPFSGTGNMATDIKTATEIVRLWKKGLQGTASKSDFSEMTAVVPDGKLLVPAEIVHGCHGIAFLFYVKAGFVFTGELGTGFVVTRLNRDSEGERWSAPSAITSGGVGWGLQIGAEKTYNCVFLQNERAVNVFGDKAKVNFGADFSVAAGPVGRHADIKGEAGTGGAALSYSYSYTKGAFAGLAINGAVAGANPMMNKTFYGRDVGAKELVSGQAGLDHRLPELDEFYRELEELMDVAKRSANEPNLGSGNSKEHLVQ